MDIIDMWSEDEFEDTVASGLIALYETKIKKDRCEGNNKLKKKDLMFFRRLGLYVAGNSRFIHFNSDPKGLQQFDIQNDGIPKNGCFGFTNLGNNEDGYRGYFYAMCFKKIGKLPTTWINRGGEYLYKMTVLVPSNSKGMQGKNAYYSMDKNGFIRGCDQILVDQPKVGRHRLISRMEYEPHIIKENEFWASITMQFLADSRFCWGIQADDGYARITLGSMKEEIKSLLYARSLPMTAAGRKRPVLHLVESHKRRIKNGIDIDITGYLRGSQYIEMGGTRFTIKPPLNGLPELSENSARYYEDKR